MLKKIILNIFSNWAFLLLSIITAFIVSPILVRQLGDEAYGVWTLIISLSGYFTLLDFGINTAIVRYISKYSAQNKPVTSQKIFSSSFTLFLLIGFIAFTIFAIFGGFFKHSFDIKTFTTGYLYSVILVLGADLAINLTCGVFVATLRGLEKFFELNIINIIFLIIKNTILVYLLYTGHSLFSISILILLTTITKHFINYATIKHFSPTLRINGLYINKKARQVLINYSSYSIVIAIAMKLIFYTDSIVIASLISVAQVTYYSIASMIVGNLENLVWAAIGVLIPVISARDARNNNQQNADLYVTGTKYIFIFITPILLVLFVAGDDFIKLWMGGKFAQPSGDVLKILLSGFLFSLSQLIANALLKGISRHKVLALILSFEATANLILSILLAPKYGIKGVAIGTTIPLLISNVFLIPYFTCKILEIKYSYYLYKSFLLPLMFFSIALYILFKLNISIDNFGSLIIFSFIVAVFSWSFGFIFIADKKHKEIFFLLILRK